MRQSCGSGAVRGEFSGLVSGAGVLQTGRPGGCRVLSGRGFTLKALLTVGGLRGAPEAVIINNGSLVSQMPSALTDGGSPVTWGVDLGNLVLRASGAPRGIARHEPDHFIICFPCSHGPGVSLAANVGNVHLLCSPFNCFRDRADRARSLVAAVPGLLLGPLGDVEG